MTRVLRLDADAYSPHGLHSEERIWREKNCYIDIWVEVVHSLGQDPMAMLPFVLSVDFEGDQWTFWKPVHAELWSLYGIDVQELNVWRPPLEHAEEHLRGGKLISTEADAFWLPDTAGTDYRRQHTKTTIVLNDLDVAAQRLGYFHNAGYFSLTGEDFVQTFRVGFAADPEYLPLFAEIVKVDRVVRRSPAELRSLAWDLVKRHLERRPQRNPVLAFGARFAADLAVIQSQGLDYYHRWAFATVRQLGGAFETAALFVRWLEPTLEPAAAAFDTIANGMKTLILKAARAANAKRALDVNSDFELLARAWQAGLDELEGRVARER